MEHKIFVSWIEKKSLSFLSFKNQKLWPVANPFLCDYPRDFVTQLEWKMFCLTSRVISRGVPLAL